MSFRNRLALFFLMLVAIPVAVIALLATNLTADSREGKADARLGTALETAIAVYEDDVDEARAIAVEILADPEVSAAFREGASKPIESTLAQAGKAAGLEYLNVVTPDGAELSAIPARRATATATVDTGGTGGRYVILASVTGPSEYVEDVSRLTGMDVALVGPDGVQASTQRREVDALPAAGDTLTAEAGDAELRAAAGSLGAEGANRVVMFTGLAGGGFFDSRPRIVIIVLAFLALALGLIALIYRTLQGQIESMLGVARRIGGGDFSARVPVVGRDEMAGLAAEFNSMSDRLENYISELRRQRDELTLSARRLGKAVAEGLDREALLATIADAAIGACEAEYVRISLSDGTVIERPEGTRGEARDAAMAALRRAGKEGTRVRARRGTGYALGAPLGRDGSHHGNAMAVARVGAEFEKAEREMFIYLIDQAAVSIENITTHERVSEQAVTDELTGLANNRAFRETIDREASRAERFRHDLSLLILDVDDFKAVNDTHGHLQGDEVLREIGRILSEESRAIDEAARYGGEEFVVALPETDLGGAVEVAERIRARLESSPVDMLDGGEPLRVTASFGAASMPASAKAVNDLLAAADEALYEAKRAGKNRVVAAPGEGSWSR